MRVLEINIHYEQIEDVYSVHEKKQCTNEMRDGGTYKIVMDKLIIHSPELVLFVH